MSNSKIQMPFYLNVKNNKIHTSVLHFNLIILILDQSYSHLDLSGRNTDGPLS